MENSKEVIDHLCCALIWMPNVKKVTISPNYYFFLDSYRHSRYFLEPEPVYNEVFVLLSRVLSLTDTKLQELKIESDDNSNRDECGITKAAFREMSHMSHCCDAFRSLRKITITAHVDDVDGWMTGHMAEILSCATDLEHLDIIGIIVGYNDRIPARYFLRTSTWSRLTSLSLANTVLDQGELLGLLGRHLGTLNELCLHGISLTNGLWEVVLEWMKLSLSLQIVQINYVAEKDNEENLANITVGPSAQTARSWVDSYVESNTASCDT